MLTRHALRTALGAAALVVPLVACDPQTDDAAALAQREPAAAVDRTPASAEPLPYSRCGSEQNPCLIEGITVTARRQSARG
jgi:hypothetical protein